jgi:hypothetical protein
VGDEVWAVGTQHAPSEGSVILHGAGGVWTRLELPPNHHLFAIDMSSSSEGWAVGSYDGGPLFYHWTGADWIFVPGPPGGSGGYGVDSVSASDAWAVGLSGQIWRWTGSQWNQVESPTSRSLRAVAAVAGDDVWAVGEEVALHWDGEAWSVVPTPMDPPAGRQAPLPVPPLPPDVLRDLDMLSATDGWAVGVKTDFLDGWLLRWNGAAWVEAGEAPPLWAVDALSAEDIWAVGNSVWHWNSTEWVTVTQPLPAYVEVASLDLQSPAEGWAVGSYGAILHWQGDHWQAVSSPAFPPNELGHVLEVDADAGSSYEGWWAAGNSNRVVSDRAKLYHWQGTGWHAVPFSLEGYVQDIAIVSTGESWAVATETWNPPGSAWSAFLRWDGVQWLTATQPISGVRLYGLDMPSATEGWAIGTQGDPAYEQPALYHWDGANWSAAPAPLSYGRLNDIEMLSADEGWIAGTALTPSTQRPLLLRWHAGAWTQVPVPDTGDSWLNAVGFASTTDGWAAGGGWSVPASFLLRWDGSAWRLASSLGNAVRDIELASSTAGWMAGFSGLYQLQCGHWAPVQVPASTISLLDVAVVSEVEAWSAADGRLLHYQVAQPPDFACQFLPMLAQPLAPP